MDFFFVKLPPPKKNTPQRPAVQLFRPLCAAVPLPQASEQRWGRGKYTLLGVKLSLKYFDVRQKKYTFVVGCGRCANAAYRQTSENRTFVTQQ